MTFFGIGSCQIEIKTFQISTNEDHLSDGCNVAKELIRIYLCNDIEF